MGERQNRVTAAYQTPSRPVGVERGGIKARALAGRVAESGERRRAVRQLSTFRSSFFSSSTAAHPTTMALQKGVRGRPARAKWTAPWDAARCGASIGVRGGRMRARSGRRRLGGQGRLSTWREKMGAGAAADVARPGSGGRGRGGRGGRSSRAPGQEAWHGGTLQCANRRLLGPSARLFAGRAEVGTAPRCVPSCFRAAWRSDRRRRTAGTR